MRTVGIIAELNPFHNGHAAFIDAARKAANADYCIVVMSGDYVQRGEPAIMPKRLRTEAALMCGADLVIELPPRFSCASAEAFACGAVSVLHETGVVTDLAFGTETGSLTDLKQIANVCSDEPARYREVLKESLKSGMPFPQAREAAVTASLPAEEANICTVLLSLPNASLGIEYLRAVHAIGSSMQVHALPRAGAPHHAAGMSGSASSATALRTHMLTDGPDSVLPCLPEPVRPLFSDAWERACPVSADDFSILLRERLLTADRTSLTALCDLNDDLAGRILRYRNDYDGFGAFCSLLKTRAYTYSRISRILMHLLLGIRTEDVPSLPELYADSEAFSSGYLKILGFRRDARPLLSAVHSASSIPMVSGKSDLKNLSEKAKNRCESDRYPTLLYQSVLAEKFKQPFRHELCEQPVIL